METPSPSSPQPNDVQRRTRFAIGMLFLACALWGASFTWVKAAMAGMARAVGARPGEILMIPAVYLGFRFLVAAALWAVVFRKSLRGWNASLVRRSALLGGTLGLGMLLQQLGLDRTSEAVSAFLTSLAVVFTPLFIWAIYRRRPDRRVAAGVALGACGIYVMTVIAAPASVGGQTAGNVLGVACAVAFAINIVCLDRYGDGVDPFALTLGMFAVVGVICLVTAEITGLAEGSAVHALDPWAFGTMLAGEGVALNLAFAIVFSTIGAFGLMFRYQPQVNPNVAAITYLAEPVFAALFAAILAGSLMSGAEMVGGALILTATFVAKGTSSRTT